jgi:hypothetical protein
VAFEGKTTTVGELPGKTESAFAEGAANRSASNSSGARKSGSQMGDREAQAAVGRGEGEGRAAGCIWE